MAKKRNSSNQTPSSFNRFDKGLNTDVRDYHLNTQSWTHARNAINNSHIGDLGELGNEPSNKFCAAAPYTIIGAVHMENSLWWIFSTNDTDSEIGTFDENSCTYTRVVNDQCLNFRKTNQISGASRPTFDCSHRVYWQDNLNPDRTLKLDDVPWEQECYILNECEFCEPAIPLTLECDKIRLEVFMSPPCPVIERGPEGGSIYNGSYYIHIAYVINSQRVTDYFPMSNIIHIFEHDEANASLDITITDLDEDNFDEYEIAIVQQISNKLSVKKLGMYSTRQNKVTVDVIDPVLESIDPDLLVVSNPIADKSEGIFTVGKYLFRTGVTSKFDFNYQPWANQIKTKWQAITYPEKYYKNGGSNVGYMRDEVYSFFIRFRYRTGDFSPSFHIPGRPPQLYEIPTAPPGPALQMLEDADYNTVENNNIEQEEGLQSKVFYMFNTANGSAVNIPLPDGGTVVAEGQMGYWESDEIYDDNSAEIWNATYLNPNTGQPTGGTTDTRFDLCGQPIRHHRFPENTLYSGTNPGNTITNHYVNDQKIIRVFGVAFDNIQPPVDNYGILIPNIIGYEILRGSRTGNKTVLYKGMINNMRHFAFPEAFNTNRLGLYPNYPYNPVLNPAEDGGQPDWFTSSEETSWEPLTGNVQINSPEFNYQNYYPNTSVSPTHFTFHSPDTNFYKPFLGQKELKIYGAMYGNAEGSYVEAEEHPKHTFVTDLTFFVALIVGVGYAISQTMGKITLTNGKPTWYRYPTLTGGSTGAYTYTNCSNLQSSGAGVVSGIQGSQYGLQQAQYEGLSFLSALGGYNSLLDMINGNESYAHAQNALSPDGTGVRSGDGSLSQSEATHVPPILAAFSGGLEFLTNVGKAADVVIKFVRNASKYRQFALQFQGHCGYEKFAGAYRPNRRRIIDEAVYLKSHLQNYQTDYRINNVLRIKTVAFNTTESVATLVGSLRDGSMDAMRVSDFASTPANPKTAPFQAISRQAASHYVAFKTRLRSQYGKIESVQQLPTNHCIIPISQTYTDTIFGGDTYIGRYQEKNTFYHFYRWMTDQVDGALLNYHLYDTIQHTAFWMDTDPFDVMEFVASIEVALSNAISGGSGSAIQTFFNSLVTPSDKHCFDRMYPLSLDAPNQGTWTVKNSFIHLFHSTVRDYFVESVLNVDMRDWDGINVQKQHWDVLQDLRTMFKLEYIKAGNYYKLDRSLSVDYLPYSKVAWGFVQDRDYSPEKAETCYTYYPRRLLYSLPQPQGFKKDNWSAFLANNFKDFRSEVTAIKAIRDTGIMLLFKNQAPGLYPGVDELQLKSGTSITVGDGGLFARQMQRLSNTDLELQYGSCQSRRGVVNTPAGLFFISQDQGKIFQMSTGLKEITLTNNQYWFNQYLPYQILLDFPDFDLLDNTIIGVGCQTIYDNEYSLVYFCKRDFRAKPEYLDMMVYQGDGVFIVDQITKVFTGDPRYFNDASWTISYDGKTGQEISWHDWHPNLGMSSKNTFLTIKDSGIWRHNESCDSYCNFYGVDHPFEVEFQIDNLPAVTTLRNIEYFMQVFEYAGNCRDRFHVLDFNFDETIIYNSEQVSGLLNLNLSPKNDVGLLKSYPIVGLNQIDIVYSKVEQKYRINQFWDITNDRGEFSIANETIWITEPNGYIKNLNPVNLNYSKQQIQRKKMRHNNNRVLLRRKVSGNKKMLVIVNSTKIQNSPR